MMDNGTLRRLSTDEEMEAITRAGGVAKEQVKLAPMWHKTRMLVQLLVPGGNQQAMDSVVSRNAETLTFGPVFYVYDWPCRLY